MNWAERSFIPLHSFLASPCRKRKCRRVSWFNSRSTVWPVRVIGNSPLDSVQPQTGLPLFPSPLFLGTCALLVEVHCWTSVLQPPAPALPQTPERRDYQANLRPLGQTPWKTCGSTSGKIALVNARSVVNKRRGYVGEFNPFAKLLPPDCTYFSSPRSTGRSGGVASEFKN